MKAPAYIVCAAVLAATTGSSAWAATCADRDAVVSRLEQRFDETAVAYAMSDSKNVMEVYASSGMRTWSILVTLPDTGLTCLAASGKGQVQLDQTLSMM